jgi:putative ABC transport system substrate-binding protein
MLCAVSPARAESPAKIPRIGFLTNGTEASPLNEAFRKGLRFFGYVEGKDILIESRHARGRSERLPELAVELVHLKVDVIVATSSDSALSAQQATTTIPIVFGSAGDPVAIGLVASLARPGGNVTGMASVSNVMRGKGLELLKEVAPKNSLVAVLCIPRQEKDPQMNEIEAAAHSLGLKLQLAEAEGPDHFESAFSAIKRGGAGALIVLSSPMFASHRTRIVDLAAMSRLPAVFPASEYVDAGGLMSYGPNNIDLYRRAAYYVDRILKGTKPADLPVETPTRFELVINLKTAKRIGVTIPESVLQRADRVIE